MVSRKFDSGDFRYIEVNEVIEKIEQLGYADFVELLLTDPEVWTKKGRLNKSAVSRKLGWKTVRIKEVIEKCQEMLGDVLTTHEHFD